MWIIKSSRTERKKEKDEISELWEKTKTLKGEEKTDQRDFIT